MQADTANVLGSDVSGPVNLAAPEPVHLRRFVEALGEVLGRPTPLRVPDRLLRGLGGRMAREMSASTRAVPGRLLESGFTFAYSDLEGALRHLLGRTVPSETEADQPTGE